jgi:8-oxo-dGTP pyrophosphatase MutT (NUDIX family)
VFDHVDVPDAGTQVPAGGIDPGESVEQAARREVAEETGLRGVRVVEVLGTSDAPHPETGAPPQYTTYLLATCDEPRDAWTWRVDGAGEDEGMLFRCWFTPLPLSGVRLAGSQGEFLHRLRALP